MNSSGCFFSTRTAVGAENMRVTLYFSTMLHQMPASGLMGMPSYMTVAMPAISGPYTIYAWPTTQPMSEMVKKVSPGLPQNICCIDAASAAAGPPAARGAPGGGPGGPGGGRRGEGAV